MAQLSANLEPARIKWVDVTLSAEEVARICKLLGNEVTGPIAEDGYDPLDTYGKFLNFCREYNLEGYE